MMRRRLLRLVLLVALPVAAVLLGIALWLASGRYVDTENAYVKNDIVHVAAEVDGRVIAVSVEDHQAVAAGDPLFAIDPEPYAIALARAEAELGTVADQIASLRAEYRAAAAEIGEVQARLAFNQRQVDRYRNLQSRGAASTVRLDEARLELDVSRERIAVIRARMQRILASLGGDLDLPTEKQALYREAVARRDKAASDLKRTAVIASVAGIVSNMHLQPGEYLEAGDRAFTLIATERPWIEANLKETQLTHVRVGQPATFTVDAYPDRAWKAVVESISPATGAEFAVLPAQNATGNWVKVVQRLPVRLRILDPVQDPPLRAGMTATVSIDTGRERHFGDLLGQ